ncbi:MAG: isoprenylcysteine carboxylmethyltransferase family protein [Methanothrix sp.]|jgi:protein-S-isoprenylcysteine O-methyltransferase Ste14|nr:isoprenylcysteine carboxylmethyltransferase family protein [Methanothrix sp.]
MAVMTISGPLAISAYFVIFALVHSLLVDPGFKRRAVSAFPRFMGSFGRRQRLAYNLLATIMILPFLFILIFLPGRTLYLIPSPWSYLMICCQAILSAGLLMVLLQTGAASFLGISQLTGKDERVRLVTTGLYALTRNPLFLLADLFLWLMPLMTESLLAFNILSTIYFYLGALHEEKTLKEVFGEEYEEYRRRVPMFLPGLSKNQKANK